MVSLNLNERNYILFFSHRKVLPHLLGKIVIDSIDIPQVTTVKFLGVYVDQHLTWNNHIAHNLIK